MQLAERAGLQGHIDAGELAEDGETADIGVLGGAAIESLGLRGAERGSGRTEVRGRRAAPAPDRRAAGAIRGLGPALFQVRPPMGPSKQIRTGLTATANPRLAQPRGASALKGES